MTGTGTQADPYIVSTWNDLKSAMMNSVVYIELDADIDMNEEAPSGISKITTGKVTLDGKNHAIKNLVANSGFLDIGGNSVSFSNLKILNFVNRGTSDFMYAGNNGNFYFRHCIFSGVNASTEKIIRTSGSRYSSYAYFTATDEGGCMLNIDVCSGGFAKGSISATDSYIRLLGKNWSDDNSWSLNNSYIEERISGSAFSDCYNSVIDAGCPDNSNFSVSNCLNLLITDKFTGNLSSETGIKKVTAEQLTDAVYLESIGFPIGVD